MGDLDLGSQAEELGPQSTFPAAREVRFSAWDLVSGSSATQTPQKNRFLAGERDRVRGSTNGGAGHMAR